MLRFVSAALLTTLACAAVPAAAQGSRYIQMETEDAYVLMDEEGVAYRYAKDWACRHSSWGAGADPVVYGPPEFIAFKQRQISEGSWGDWTCGARPGLVIFSRDLQRAQRRMNSNATFGAPYVPETGRYNAEMLEYNRVVLDAAISSARSDYQVAFVNQLTSLLRETPVAAVTRDNAGQLLNALKPKATARKLARPFEMCSRMVDNIYDYVSCRMTDRDSAIKQAEERFQVYQDRLRGLGGQNAVTPETLVQLGEDAAAIDKFIREARREGDESVGTTPAR